MKKRFFVLSDLLFILSAISILLIFGYRFMNADGDILWHIKQGEWYIANGTWYLNKELFTFLYDFQKWSYLSWLGDVVFAFINSKFGFKGLILFTDIYIVFTLYMMYRYLVKKGVNVFVVLFVFMAGYGLISTHWIVRNHIFGHIFLIIWFIVIEKFYEGKNRWMIWTLPILNIIWVNFHGSFLYGLTIPFFFACAAFYEWIIKKDIKRKKDYFLLTALCFILVGTAVVNPYGIDFFVDFVKSWGLGGALLVGFIGDFSSPDFQSGLAFQMNIFFGIVIFSLIYFRKRIKIEYSLILIYYIYRAVQFSRDLSILGILALLIVPQILNQNINIESENRFIAGIRNMAVKIRDSEIKKAGYSVVFTIIFSVLLIIYIPGINKQLNEYSKINESIFPVKAVEYMKKNNIKGRMLNNYLYGGYLIWKYYPEKVTFCDTRGTFFKLEDYMPYMRALAGSPEYIDVIKKYKIEYIIINKNRDTGIYNVLKNEKQVNIIYQDDFTVLYKVNIGMGGNNEKKINNSK